MTCVGWQPPPNLASLARLRLLGRFPWRPPGTLQGMTLRPFLAEMVSQQSLQLWYVFPHPTWPVLPPMDRLPTGHYYYWRQPTWRVLLTMDRLPTGHYCLCQESWPIRNVVEQAIDSDARPSVYRLPMRRYYWEQAIDVVWSYWEQAIAVVRPVVALVCPVSRRRSGRRLRRDRWRERGGSPGSRLACLAHRSLC
jgi:hypothetical protein